MKMKRRKVSSIVNAKKKEILICNENVKKEIPTHNESENKDPLVCNGCGSDSKISTTSSENTDKGTSTNTEDESKKENASSSDNQISKEFFKIPSEALVSKIVRQAEKIKSLTKDWRVVAHSLEFSKLLELNLEKTKIRRIEPIPKMEETSLGKTIIIFNLPLQNPTAEELEEMFSKFGAIVHAEIMTPKSENYNTYHKRCKYHNQEVATATFGSLEFENFEDAMSAIKDVDSHLPKENKMKVVPLMSQVYKNKTTKILGSIIMDSILEEEDSNKDLNIKGTKWVLFLLMKACMEDLQWVRSITEDFIEDIIQPKLYIPLSQHVKFQKKIVRDTYLPNGEDGRSGSFARSRQLKSSNRMNINKQFGSPHPRFADGTFGYRATHFEG
ncbi:la-related protein 6 [Caerostris extrusa]|uniref:La-related protein 6 n=1 Tax=Caerostris extrusa TaxID=172846 RepID=A0AAV4MNW7_CAEEX|nr:la-related protein 6 [Caerostris extrusa]